MPLLEITGNWVYLMRRQCYKTFAWETEVKEDVLGE
jgi:hypothetical protein